MKYSRWIKITQQTLYQLCNYMEAVATEHAAKLGISIERLADKGLAWVLAKMHIEIKLIPIGNNILYTWPVAISKAQFRRDFEMKNENGDVVVTAATEWVIVNLSTRRISRIPDFVAAVHPVTTELAMKESDYKFDIPQNAVELRITHANDDDIDRNNHVNNTHYIKWIERAIPKEIGIKSFEIIYKTEAFLGDRITARGGSDNGAFLVSLCKDKQEFVRARINGALTKQGQ